MCVRIVVLLWGIFFAQCAETAVEVTQCRIRRIVHRVELPKCIPKRLLSLACRGHCESYTQYVPTTNDVERVCKCCQAEGSAVRRVRIMCRNMDSLQMEMRVVQVALPTGCMCRPCAAVGDKVPDVLNPTQHKVMDILAFEKRNS